MAARITTSIQPHNLTT